MIDEIARLIDGYRTWLKDNTSLRTVKDWVEITAPFLDRHNDYIQIYAKKQGNEYIMTDDSHTIQDLKSSGCLLTSPKRLALLKMTLAGFGVRQDGEALTINARPENFALRKHNLMQAILAVNDMFYLAEPVVASVFMEDVENWLNKSGIRFIPRYKLTGKTNYDHMFDFAIPKSEKQPIRLIRAVNRPTKDYAQGIIWSWVDTVEVREPDSQLFALLNDEQEIPKQVIEALENYDVKAVPWKHRENIKGLLAA